MHRLKTFLKQYLILAGVSVHFAFAGAYVLAPEQLREVYYRGYSLLETKIPLFKFAFSLRESGLSVAEEIKLNFGEWLPLPVDAKNQIEGIWVNGESVFSLSHASRVLKNGDVLKIGAGTYTQPLVIKANDVTVIGVGHVVIKQASAEGKGAIITKGNNTKIINIECREIRVRDRNGACVRHEGENLTLSHVYFHHSEQGLLTGRWAGTVLIEDSRFEQLGLNGRAHGIYVDGGELIIRNSMILAGKNEGHEVKSRAAITIIENSVIASFSSKDSRLIDIPDGGTLIVRGSVLQMGVGSSNQDLIGYGLENRKYPVNQVKLHDNLIIMERRGVNTLFHGHPSLPKLQADQNIIISEIPPAIEGLNFMFSSRAEAGLEAHPMLPKIDPKN